MDDDMQKILDIVENSVTSSIKKESPPPTTPLEGGFLVPNNSFTSTDYLKKKADSLVQKAQNLPSETSVLAIDEDELFDILEDIEDINRIVRESLLESPFYDNSSRIEGYFDRAEIRVCTPQNAIVRLIFPPLLRAKRSNAYNVYWQAKAALKNHFESRGKPCLLRKKFVLIYKKYATNLSADYTCDNDNWEMKRVTNAISEFFNITDNADTFSFFYTAEKAEKNYVEVTLIERKNMGLFLDYITTEKRV